mmetsp:Transcript_13764/g.35432  ORF Transcript_13764/g.35432 Transcript_13764/m.35432 type:complete len:425 (+) Transcript_13764:400-1674(+)
MCSHHDSASQPEELRKGQLARYHIIPESAIPRRVERGESDASHRDTAINELRVRCEAGAPIHFVTHRPELDLLVFAAQLHKVVDHAERDWPTLIDVRLWTHLSLRQRLNDGLSEIIDEVVLEAKRGHARPARDPALLGEISVLNVDLLERLDVLRDERDGHCDHLGDAAGAELADLVVRVRLQPLDRSHLGLVRQRVVVRVPHRAQLGHDCRDCVLCLCLVRVAKLLDVRLGKPVRGEEDVRLVDRLECVALLLDQPRESRHVTGARVPRGDDDGTHLPELLVIVIYALEKPQRGAGGGDRELRVERQHDQPAHAVSLDRFQRLLRVRVPVAHRYVRLGLHPACRQGRIERLPLGDSGGKLRRAAADGRVALTTGRSTRARDDVRERPVHPRQKGGERDDLGIGEEVIQERLNIIEAVWPTEVE